MINKNLIWIFVIMLLIVIPISTGWSGPPPSPVVYYGYAYVNGSVAPIGTNISIWANGGTFMMDSKLVTAVGGYFTGLKMYWDDPDTIGDEGITYSNNAEAITFKIGNEWTIFPTNVYVLSSDAGKAKEINLSYLYNFPPELYFINDYTIAQDNFLNFYIYAIDNNSYRNDTLSFSENSPGSLTNTERIYPANNTWRSNFSWTPDWSHACTGTFDVTFTVTDDGTPKKSDSQIIRINVTNVNDAPVINDGITTALNNTLKNINLATVLSYSDRDSCFGDGKTFVDITVSPNPNATLNITNNSTGAATFIANNTGTYKYTIKVIDTEGAFDTAVLTITVTAPPVPNGIIVRKNIYYVEQANNTIIYEVTDEVFNFLGHAVIGANLTDNEANISESFDLADKAKISFSRNITINKTSSIYLFEEAVALVEGALYYSNQPRILIPGAGAFDVSVDAPSSVVAGATITADILIVNIGADSQDVLIEYWIEDMAGNVYATGQKTVYVAINSTVNTTASLTAPNVAGTYLFYAKVRWNPDNTSTATAYDAFEVSAVAVPVVPAVPVAGEGLAPEKRKLTIEIKPDIRYAGEEVFINIYVYYKDKKYPIYDVLITLYDDTGALIEKGRTDKNGSYKFLPVKVGLYRVTAEKKGYRSAETYFDVMEKPPAVLIPILNISAMLEKPNLLYLWWWYLVIIALCIVLWITYLKKRYREIILKHRARRDAKKFAEFIRHAVKRGLSKSYIKEKLIKQGWPSRVIDNYYDFFERKEKDERQKK